MAIWIRLMMFGIIGFVLGLSEFGINTWQFWIIISIANVIYICGRIEEMNEHSNS